MSFKNVIIIGAGKTLYSLWPTICKGYNVVGILDNNVSGQVYGYKVYTVDKIIDFNYDLVFILPLNYMFELRDQLLSLEVPETKIIPFIGENRNLKISDFYFEKDRCLFDNGYVKFELNTSSGNGGVKGIFFENLYNFMGIEDDTIVIDIGLNIGVSSIFFAAKANVKKVMGFEPLSRNFIMAKKNIELNIPEVKNKIEIYNFGLSNSNVNKRFSYSKKFPTTFSICGIESESLEDELVDIRSAEEVLKPILDQYANNRIVVKLDCEGAEYEIFESLDKAGMLNRIDMFMIEYHLYDNPILEQYLNKNGFWYVKMNTTSYIGFIYAFNRNNGRV